jgi:hypothetical protein
VFVTLLSLQTQMLGLGENVCAADTTAFAMNDEFYYKKVL